MRMSRRMGLLGKKKTAPPTLLPTLAELFADMTVVSQAGKNSSSLEKVTVSDLYIGINPSIYIFAFHKDSFAIHHLLSNGSEYGKTTLYRATDDSNATDIYMSGGGTSSPDGRYYKYSLSKNGSSSTTVYGGTIIAATFPSYTDDQISAVFSEISVKNSAGRDTASTLPVSLSISDIAGEIILTTYSGAMCAALVTSPTEYICTLDYKYSATTSYKARNYVDNGMIYLSNKTTSYKSVYGGTILTI